MLATMGAVDTSVAWNPAEERGRIDWTYVPGAHVAAAGPIRIRRYHPADRIEVRRICADTGFLGKPVDPLFQDRELFADYLTAYFTDQEPESTFIAEHDGRIAGYLMGCRDPDRMRRYERTALPRIALTGILRLLLGRYNRASRRFAWWVMTRSRSETPAAPRDWAHFHINLLPGARSLAGSRLLFDVFLTYLRDAGVSGVFGQMASYDGKRGVALFERYGFEVLATREVTKYRELHPEPVVLCTIARRLEGFCGIANRARERVETA